MAKEKILLEAETYLSTKTSKTIKLVNEKHNWYEVSINDIILEYTLVNGLKRNYVINFETLLYPDRDKMLNEVAILIKDETS